MLLKFDCQDLALSCLSTILLYFIELSIKLMKLGLDETPDTCRYVKILTLYERLVSYLGSLYNLRLHLLHEKCKLGGVRTWLNAK